jgi:hypothetical protein
MGDRIVRLEKLRNQSAQNRKRRKIFNGADAPPA